MTRWKTCISASTLALGALPALAGIVDYTFDGANAASLGPTESFGAAPYTVVVSAHVSTAGGAWQATNVSRNTNALGVNSGVGANPGQVDSNGPDRVEGLLFDFGSLSFGALTVTLTQYRVGGANPDNLSVWIGDTLDLLSATAPLETVVYANQNPANPLSIDFGARYLFIAAADDGLSTTTCAGTNSNCFRVDHIAAVPEPGSLALAGLALGGLGLVRHRRAA